MEYRQLGGSGLKVPVLSLGTGTFGGTEFFRGWGASDVAEAIPSSTSASTRRSGVPFVPGPGSRPLVG
jgi:aryl-alcohol dehydrogenase-like predicted oxidoreductase